MSEIPTRRRVVVGVDGSLPSVFALRWAGREARLRGAELCAVTVDAEAAATHAPYAPVGSTASRADRWAELGRTLVDAIDAALGPRPEVPVHEHVEEGRPPKVLTSYAEGADLLVLGTRQPETASQALGATVRACLRAAACPVVVIRYDDDLSWRDRPEDRVHVTDHRLSSVH